MFMPGRPETCETCEGSGKDPRKRKRKCPTCLGRGTVEVMEEVWFGNEAEPVAYDLQLLFREQQEISRRQEERRKRDAVERRARDVKKMSES